jgi:excisionase family DNA binding protein
MPAVDTLASAGHRQNGHADQVPDQAGHAPPTHGLTIEEAATRLGLSVTTVRRRIKQKKLRATLVAGDHGPEYRVQVEPGQATTLAGERRHDDGQDDQPSLGADQPAVNSLVALVDRLTTENSRLQDERAELFGRLGYFQAQLEQAQTTIKALEAPKEPAPAPAAPRWPDEPTPADPPRPWWRFW